MLIPTSTQKVEELIARLKEKYMVVIVTHYIQQAALVNDKMNVIFPIPTDK